MQSLMRQFVTKGEQLHPWGRNDFTSSAALQTVRSKELRLHVLCLAAKAKSFREISGLEIIISNHSNRKYK